ncbi:MAG: exo-beta-N-acetylmuramidase NamZ family protein [Arcticibacter sp.]
MKKAASFLILLLLLTGLCPELLAKTQADAPKGKTSIITGADQTDKYLSYLKGKRVAMVANQTSIIGNKLSVDSLLSLGIKIVKVFGPEHGFRGNASNGDHVDDEVDAKTGIPIFSLYGKAKKPSKEQLKDVDLVIFDIQDVGCRFYTNLNTLEDVMEACAENGKELMIFDRPNPNGYFIDGPILEDKFKSGIGQHKIPITHAMTIGEFALMLNGEGYMDKYPKCKLNIIKVANYNHSMPYELPVNPSPNLNTQQSILLYPSMCLFEGTMINYGRGTYMPFTVLGAPDLKEKYEFSFKPVGIKGMSENPLYKDSVCYGIDLRNYDTNILRKTGQINLSWLIEMYNAFPDKKKFFDHTLHPAVGSFDYRSGTATLRESIIAGKSEAEIRKSWEPGLKEFRKMRKKYLLYPDK